MKRDIKVFAPASVSNIGCGFDIMGFAINGPGDEIVLRLNDSGKIEVKKITGDDGKISCKAEENTAAVSVKAMLDDMKLPYGVEIEIDKKMPLGSGLGSSAASAVASVFALNQLLDKPAPIEKILEYGMKGEYIASGAYHADNVAPCLYGGLVLIRGYDPVDIIELNVPENLYCTILYSDIEVKTIMARSILPKAVSLNKAITQWGNVGGLVAGFMKNDMELIRRSIKDVIVEPVRSVLIPGYYSIKDAALEAGALGCNISGSGPSVFALCDSEETAFKAGKAMQEVVARLDIKNTLYISKVNCKGPEVL